MTALNEVPVFDRASALLRVGGDLQLLREIGALFVDESGPALQELRQAVAARDSAAIERKAHELKGSIANFGAGSAFQAAFELEQRGRSGNLEHIDGLFNRFADSLGCLCAELRALAA